MSKLSKSVKRVAVEAILVGESALSEFSHLKSPKKYTQAQLFACLVVKERLGLDYRGVVAVLEDFEELQHVLGLEAVPHYTTLQKASIRLLRKRHVRRLIEETLSSYLEKKAA